MSHGRERKEKDCLNCGTIVEGRYCQACGQENTEPHETFWGMVNHFFSDITHFDGNFFRTIGVLLTKPGFLSRQYIAGRRNSYLNPVRMYIFTASLFFLVFFSVYSVKDKDWSIGNRWNGNQLEAMGDQAYENAHTAADSAEVREAISLFSKTRDSSVAKTKKNRVIMLGNNDEYKSLKEYDSIQAALPEARRDPWFESLLVRKGLDLNDRYPGQEGKLTADLFNKFMHTFPYLLFISLPLYGFFLYLLYIRKKRFYFADHGIFLIHQYVFTFIVMLVLILMLQLPYKWLNFFNAALIIYGIIYTVRAFRTFYGQGWGKTIFKFFLFNTICVISLGFLFAIFFGYAFFQV